jgi:electron transport complex protein RnfA
MNWQLAATWPLQNFLLVPYGIGYLKTMVFNLVIALSGAAGGSCFEESMCRPFTNPWAFFLPLITTKLWLFWQ